MRRRLAVALVLLAALPAAADPACRPDRISNTICRDLPARPHGPLPRPEAFPLPAPRAPVTIPAWRTDAFGTIRPGRGTVTGTRPFGSRPRPEAPARACATDALGHTRCR